MQNITCLLLHVLVLLYFNMDGACRQSGFSQIRNWTSGMAPVIFGDNRSRRETVLRL